MKDAPRGDLELDELDRAMREKFEGWSHPLRRLIVVASGQDRVLLHFIPGEYPKAIITGIGVLIAGTMSVVGVFIGTSMLVDPEPSIKVRGAIAIFSGVVIVLVDQLIIRTPINPYYFPSNVLASLWDPKRKYEWRLLFSPGNVSARSARNWSRWWILPITIGTRLVLALLIGWMIADVVLMQMFSAGVTSRTYALYNADVQARVDKINARYNGEIDSLQTKVTTLDLQQQKAKWDDAIDKAPDGLQVRFNLLTAYRADEEAGNPNKPVVDANGYIVPGEVTTGIPTQGRHYKSVGAGLENLGTQLKDAKVERQKVVDQLKGREAVPTATPGQGLSVVEQLAAVTKKRQDELDSQKILKPTDPPPPGLAIRLAALKELEDSPKPWISDPQEAPPCGAGFPGVVCEIGRFFSPGGALGEHVGAIRAILVLIDTIPVTLKVAMSFSRRRPIDVAMAALEESSIARFINALDDEMTTLSAKIEKRTAKRVAATSAAGAEYIRIMNRVRDFENAPGHEKSDDWWKRWGRAAQKSTEGGAVAPEEQRSGDDGQEEVRRSPSRWSGFDDGDVFELLRRDPEAK